jgi:hypothetical protein
MKFRNLSKRAKLLRFLMTENTLRTDVVVLSTVKIDLLVVQENSRLLIVCSTKVAHTMKAVQH